MYVYKSPLSGPQPPLHPEQLSGGRHEQVQRGDPHIQQYITVAYEKRIAGVVTTKNVSELIVQSVKLRARPSTITRSPYPHTTAWMEHPPHYRDPGHNILSCVRETYQNL